MIRSLLLFPILLCAALVYAQQQQEPKCREEDRRCQAHDKTSPFYYRCSAGQWTLYTCGNGYTCSTGGGGAGATCVQSNPAPPKACIDAQRRCAGPSNPGLYYLCLGGAWKTYTCGNAHVCKEAAPLQATCDAIPPQCKDGAQRCIGAQSPGLYYHCAGGQWQQKACNRSDRCVNIPGGLINCQVGTA
ncbi:hypothetical protein GGF46_001122 [Coemansia sp. RSA 552]|nr:hypothetical protein GGF46_001122 [Coemansia sp. RSA 552]